MTTEKEGVSLRLIIAIAACKLLYFIGSRIGRGSSLPGQIALSICPKALERLELPDTIIAVTGSNGKTSTADLLVHALTAGGKSVGWNHEGANQIEGVATLLLRIATFRGKVKRDALVLECDERFARKTFSAVHPSAIVVTNLCRDQLTRNGHPEFIMDCIKSAVDALGSKAKLVLNADDPYVAALATLCGISAVWFGVRPGAANVIRECTGGRFSCVANNTREPSPCALVLPHCDDGAFCPICKGRMTYDYRITGHYGSYRCSDCGLMRPDPDVEACEPDNQTGAVEIVCKSGAQFPKPPSVAQLPKPPSGAQFPKPPSVAQLPKPPSGIQSPKPLSGAVATHHEFSETITTHLAFPNLTGAYNLTAAVAAAASAGVSAKTAAAGLDGYDLKGGRTVHFSAGGRNGILLISKHENSLSYNQSLTWIAGRETPCTVIILVDSISRKYFTSETSWLWDVDFDLLAGSNVRDVVLAGRYVNELMMRFAMSEIDTGKLRCIEDPAALPEYVERHGEDDIYAITCFADKQKLLKAFK